MGSGIAQVALLSSYQKVVLNPILMNGGDSITLKMLVSKLNGDLKVDGRIVGVKEIKELGGTHFPTWVGLLTASIIAGIAGFVSSDFGTEQFVPSFLTGTLVSLTAVAIAGLGYYFWQKNNPL